MNRYIFILLCSVGLPTIAQEKSNIKIQLIGEKIIPNNFQFKETLFGGISGIDMGEGENLYMISDDISERNPARVYKTKLSYDDKKIDTLIIEEVLFLKNIEGNNFKNLQNSQENNEKYVSDGEAIRYDRTTKTLIFSSEGSLGDTHVFQPFVWQIDTTCKYIKSIVLPSNISYNINRNKGLRNNLAVEGLTLSPDNKSLWISTESALIEDGLPANAYITSPVRFSKIDLLSGKLERQVAYLPDKTPLKPQSEGDISENGISEILMLTDEKLLVLERSFTKGIGNSVRLYEADLSVADNIFPFESTSSNIQFVKKKLIIDFSTLGIKKIDNIEAMAWGKRLENGSRSIIFVSDNNFRENQITQILLFEYKDGTVK